jgi:hypothetical protein
MLVEIKQDGTVDITVKNYLLKALALASERIPIIKEYEFEPLLEARTFDALGYHISPDGLELGLGNNPLLEVVSIVDGDGNTLTAYNRSTKVGDYYLPGNHTPYTKIQLAASSGKNWTIFDGEYIDAISVTAYWGFRSRFNEGWISANDTVLDNPLLVGATTLTVADADGADVYGYTPRFSIGQLLRIESEYVEVSGVNTTTNALTVRRGVRGTTAAQHAQATAISVWQPEPVINRAALRWGAYLYSRQGKFEQVVIEGDVTTVFPPDAPTEVENILRELPDYESWLPV